MTVLLSVKNRGTDMMMLYRVSPNILPGIHSFLSSHHIRTVFGALTIWQTCYALPPFSGKEAGDRGSQPSISQRLRTVPFVYSADMEMALKNCQHNSQQTPAKVSV